MRSSPCLRFVVGFAAFVFAALCTACSTQTKKVSEARTPNGGAALTEAEYETVTVTGSNIPVRVPKSPTARALPPASPVIEVSADEFRNLVQRGMTPGRH